MSKNISIKEYCQIKVFLESRIWDCIKQIKKREGYEVSKASSKVEVTNFDASVGTYGDRPTGYELCILDKYIINNIQGTAKVFSRTKKDSTFDYSDIELAYNIGSEEIEIFPLKKRHTPRSMKELNDQKNEGKVPRKYFDEELNIKDKDFFCSKLKFSEK